MGGTWKSRPVNSRSILSISKHKLFNTRMLTDALPHGFWDAVVQTPQTRRLAMSMSNIYSEEKIPMRLRLPTRDRQSEVTGTCGVPSSWGFLSRLTRGRRGGSVFRLSRISNVPSQRKLILEMAASVCDMQRG